MPQRFRKDPNTAGQGVDYTIDLTDFLDGDTLTGSYGTGDVVISGPDSALVCTAVTSTSSTITLWLNAGTPGAVYLVSIPWQTTGGRQDDSEIYIRIAQT